MKKIKEAKLDIELPDGTKISARGPLAEQMARRLMDPGWHTWWPTWYGSITNTGGWGTYTVTNSSGNVISQNPATLPNTLSAALQQ